VEGNEEKGVHDQAHGPVEFLGFRECAMAALVCENPDSGEDEALHSRVGSPCEESEIGIGEERDVGGGCVDED
jgi:hypothetical protein